MDSHPSWRLRGPWGSSTHTCGMLGLAQRRHYSLSYPQSPGRSWLSRLLILPLLLGGSLWGRLGKWIFQWNANRSRIQGHHLKCNPHKISQQTAGFRGSLADLKDRTLDSEHAAPHGVLPLLHWFWPWNFQNRLPPIKPRAHFCGFRVKSGFSLLERDGIAKWTRFPSDGTSLREAASPQKCNWKINASVKVPRGLGDGGWTQRTLGRKQEW